MADGSAEATFSVLAEASDSYLVEAVDVRLLELPMSEPLAANHSTTSTRALTVIGLSFGSTGSSSDWAWGESAALPGGGYTIESARQSFDTLAALAPTLVGQGLKQLIAAPPLSGANTKLRANSPYSAAALELAAFDAVGKVHGRSLASMLGATRTHAPAGAAVGLGPLNSIISRCNDLVEAGYRRIKLKIQPGHDLAVVEAVIAAVEGPIAWHVDANGSFGGDAVAAMVELAQLGVEAIEQPFAVGDSEAAARLVSSLANSDMDCLVVADEAAVDIGAVTELSRRRAATAVTIKPSRYGGLAPASAVIELCGQLDLAISVGGMIESALGRRSLAALAATADFALTGDLSPSSRWLQVDPWSDVVVSTSSVNGALLVEVPIEPGVAPAPDPQTLDATTTAQCLVD